MNGVRKLMAALGAGAFGLVGCGGADDGAGPVVGPAEPSVPPTAAASSEVPPAATEPSETPPAEPSEQPEPTPSAPEGMPAAVLPSVDPSLEVWAGFPPPVVFEALFPGGEFTAWPEQVGQYVLSEDKGSSARRYNAVYEQQGQPGEVFEVTLEPGAMTYTSQIKRWEQEIAVAGFAVCQGEQPEWADCMVVARDSMIDAAWTGSEGAVSLEDAAVFLGELVAAFQEQA